MPTTTMGYQGCCKCISPSAMPNAHKVHHCENSPPAVTAEENTGAKRAAARGNWRCPYLCFGLNCGIVKLSLAGNI